MSSFSWFLKPKGLNPEGEKLWSNNIKTLSPNLPSEFHYLDIAKELDEFYCWEHFLFESDYKNFVRERERFRLFYSLTTEDELDVEKLIEAVVNLQLKIQEQVEELQLKIYEQEKEIESLKDEIRN
jgi:hypothetical protein